MTDKLIDNEVYTATIEFRSIGSSTFVQPTFSYSHEFSQEYLEANGDLPAAYLALRDIGLMLRMMAVNAQNTTITDDELDALSPDERARAIEEALATSTSVAKLEARPEQE